MSESTEELTAAVEGLSQRLVEVLASAGRSREQAEELSEEAGAHGWHGMAERMQQAGEALEAAVALMGRSHQACEHAATALGLINDGVATAQVVGHLDTVSTELGTASTEVGGALEKIEEAQAAVTEIGQQGLMRYTQDLYGQVTELQELLTDQRSISERELVEAGDYVERQLGK